MATTYTQPHAQGPREDYPLIIGQGHYVDDLKPPAGRPAVLYAAFARSIYAHAVIEQINLDSVRSLEGVFAAHTGEELVQDKPALDVMPMKDLKKSPRKAMAIGRVRYVGDPLAVILADTRYGAQDASDALEVDYSPLPTVVDPEEALLPEAPLLYEELGTNQAYSASAHYGDIESAFTQAEHTISLRLVNQRLAPSSIEPRACMIDFDPQTGELQAWVSSQSVYRMRDLLAQYLGLDRKQVHVHNANVGGAFGVKNGSLGEELVIAQLAMRYGRPIKWIEGRTENLQAQAQGRGQISYVEAAFQNNGRLLGLKVRSIAEIGAYLTTITAMIPLRSATFLCGPYTVQAVESHIVGVYNNKATSTAYRGAGRPEAAYILERVMDRISQELQLDPVEVRRRNLLAPDVFPYKTPTGVTYDSGNYQLALDKALALADYDGWRVKQQARRATPTQASKLIGIGLATFIELSGDAINPPPGAPREAATVRIQHDGTILVQSGTAHNGQGHFTIFAQIAANILSVPLDAVEVRMNDSALPAFSVGTFSSRITQVSGSAVELAAQAVREKALHVAAHLLEVAPDDLVIEEGQVKVRGVPSRALPLAELARMVEEQPTLIAHEEPNPVNNVAIEGLAAWRDFAPAGASYASGTHIAVVEVERETGITDILSYIAVDDCGKILNHELVEAQLHGGLAQGIGQALNEEVIYDREGQLLSSTFMDYAMPTAEQLPNFITDMVESPSPTNPLGAKGAGEAGCVGGPPAIVNAILDALTPFGVKELDMPLTPERVWQAIHSER